MIPFQDLLPGAAPACATAPAPEFLALSQGIEAPLCLVDLHGRVLHANVPFASVAGMQAAALVGRSWLSCLSMEEQAQATAAWITVVALEAVFTLQAGMPQADGKSAAHVWQAMPVRQDHTVARWIILGSAAPAQPPGPMGAGSPTWFRNGFEHAAVGIAQVAPDGSFLDANERFCVIVGHERAALLQDGFQRITHPEDLAGDEANVAALLEGRIDHYAMEKRYLRADGTTVWVQLTVGLVRRGDGAPDHFVSVIDDITQRKAAEAALATQQRLTQYRLRLSESVQNLSDPVEMMAAATAVLGAHLGVAQVGFGEIDAAQAHVTVHRDWNDGFIPSVVGTWRMDDFGPAFIRDMKAGKTIAIPDVELDERTNAPEVLAAYAGIGTRSILDVGLIRGGQQVAMIFVHHPEPRAWTPEDVELVEHTCERLWSAVERARAERALARSEAHLRAVLDALPVGVVIADAHGRLLQENAAHRALWGMQPQATSWEQYGDWVGFWPESGRRIAAHEWAMARALRSGEVVCDELVECQPFGGGARRFYLNNAAPVRDAAGGVVGGVVVEIDITERLQAQEQLRSLNATLEARVAQRTAELAAARDAAESANRAKSAFLANMSHEIRTPMNAILGLAHMLAREDATPRQAEQLAKIEGAAQHLLTIINDILDLSRIEAGKLQLEVRDFELPALLEQVRSIVGASAMAKGLNVEVDAGGVPAWLSGDDTRARQALLNYAGNAVKFTQAGSVTLRARQLQEREDGFLLVRFEVEDTGMGVEPQQVARLFEAFEQADASTTREHGGTGLGLAITRRLAELMGGSAGAHPRPGGGSIFWFTAWLGQGTAATTAAVATPRAAGAELRLRHAGARVLVVEDHPINREVALALLRAAGLQVEFAEDGATAVEKARQGHYALVLMDMHMPVMDGLQATRALREMPQLKSLPILAMTANAYDEDRAACLAAGMDDFVSKPVEPLALYATLAKWLSKGAH